MLVHRRCPGDQRAVRVTFQTEGVQHIEGRAAESARGGDIEGLRSGHAQLQDAPVRRRMKCFKKCGIECNVTNAAKIVTLYAQRACSPASTRASSQGTRWIRWGTLGRTCAGRA